MYEIEFVQTRYFKTLRRVIEETLEFIDFYHKRRFHGSLFHLPPIEFKERHQKSHFQDFSVSLLIGLTCLLYIGGRKEFKART